MNRVSILVQILDQGMPQPRREHPGDAGWDLRSRIDIELGPGERALIPTGIAIALPDGYVGLIHPRSGLAIRHGFTLVNAPGTIDAGYRGEICVIGMNTDHHESLRVMRGDRVAQLVVQEFSALDVEVVDVLPGSHRGEGGFGSSGSR